MVHWEMTLLLVKEPSPYWRDLCEPFPSLEEGCTNSDFEAEFYNRRSTPSTIKVFYPPKIWILVNSFWQKHISCMTSGWLLKVLLQNVIFSTKWEGLGPFPKRVVSAHQLQTLNTHTAKNGKFCVTFPQKISFPPVVSLGSLFRLRQVHSLGRVRNRSP